MADPANGKYAIYEEQKDSYVWATRTSALIKSTCDVMFSVDQAGSPAGQCKI